MALIKIDDLYNANYWKAFPLPKRNKCEMCLFKDGVDTVRGNALKRRIVDIDYDSMEYDSSLTLIDAVSKYTYEQLVISKMTEQPDDWDVEESGEFVTEETNWFADAVNG